MGNSMFFSFNSPASSNDTIIFLLIISNTVLEIQIPAGFASASNLAAILTASPKRLSSETITSPILIPTRKFICSNSSLP